MTCPVDILIPAFDAERWIGAAVESALAQGAGAVLVLDDGSTDGTRECLQGFGDRIRALRWPKNRGGGAARQALLEASRAPWVQYLDADDYLLPGKVARQLGLAQREEAAGRVPDVVYGPVRLREEGSGAEQVLPLPAHGDPCRLLARWQLPQTGGCLFRREALLAVGGWKPDQPCCQEHELYLRLLQAGRRFVRDDAAGAVYRQWSDETVCRREPSRTRRERMRITDRLQTWLEEVGRLTPERLFDINLSRFEVARSEWPLDRARARAYHAAIDRRFGAFRPRGPAAPGLFRLAYRALGFEGAQRLAGLRRGLPP